MVILKKCDSCNREESEDFGVENFRMATGNTGILCDVCVDCLKEYSSEYTEYHPIQDTPAPVEQEFSFEELAELVEHFGRVVNEFEGLSALLLEWGNIGGSDLFGPVKWSFEQGVFPLSSLRKMSYDIYEYTVKLEEKLKPALRRN